jgi:Flp pilus assembly protein TadD
VLAPGGSQAYECLAKLLESEGHYEESLAAAREGLCLSPFNPELHLVLGAALLRSGAQDEAAAQLRLALALKPNVAQAHALLGSALARQGRFDEAQRHLAEALRLQPDNVAAHCQLAVVLEEQQQTTQAVAHYREALRLQPDCREALNNLAWIRAANPQAELRNGAEAVELAERACRASDYRDPNLVSTLAAAYAEAGRFEEAVAAATRARDMALAGGQNDMAEETKKLIALFSARQSYREPAAPTPRK